MRRSEVERLRRYMYDPEWRRAVDRTTQLMHAYRPSSEGPHSLSVPPAAGDNAALRWVPVAMRSPVLAGSGLRR